MFIFVSELMLFVGILSGVIYSFGHAKEGVKISDVDLPAVITTLNGSPYSDIYINSKVDKKNSIVYKEVVLKFKTGTINPDFCSLLNK